MWRLRQTLTAICLCIPFSSEADPRVAKLTALVDQYAALREASGVILVAERGHVLLRRGLGFSNRELSVETRPTHRFLIGSMTKAFTAALVMRQVARGRIALDSSAVRYWPEFPDPSHGRITIRHLLTHQSGLKHWGAVSGFLEGPARLTQRPANVVALYAAQGLSFPPGMREEYSSIGYMALGVILERVTGEQFSSLLEREIFKPLGMSSTSLDDGVSIVSGRARPYRYNFVRAAYENAEYRDASTSWSTGGIVTTADDLLRWSDALSNDTLLPDSLRSLIFRRTAGDAWYGWRIDTTSFGGRAAWHVGLETGFKSQITRVPERGQTVIVLGNVRDLDTDGMTRRLFAVLQNRSVDPPKPSSAKAIYRAAAAGGGDSAAAVLRAIARRPSSYDTTHSQMLVAAIELRSDKACDRAAAIYDAWLAVYPGRQSRAAALVGAADCRIQLGQIEAARSRIDELERLDPGNASLPDLKRRSSTP